MPEKNIKYSIGSLEGMTIQELSKELNLPENRIQVALDSLVRRGLVDKVTLDMEEVSSNTRI